MDSLRVDKTPGMNHMPIAVSYSHPEKTPERLYENRLYGISRFLLVRKSYSFIQSILQTINPLTPKRQNQSVFEGFDVNQCIETMREDAVAFGLHLPTPMTQEIYEYANQNFCIEPGYSQKFRVGEVKNGHLPDGHQPIRALVLLPNGGDGISDCSAIEQLVEDPILLQIAHDYLHYWPTRITRHLTWMMASKFIEEAPPAATWHYDIAGYNFMTAYFYITPILDERSGPHVMVKGSHLQKPWHMLLSSARHSEEKVFKTWGRENKLVIKGESGFGFVQDPSCLHKIQPPTQSNRLLLQIRYS